MLEVKTIETHQIENSFNVSFNKGEFFDSFCEYVHECLNRWFNSSSIDSPIAPIVQSSGHGKTR